MRKTLHIAIPSDQNYVQGLTATAVSFAVYAKPETTLHFHVLDGGIRDESLVAFERAVLKWHAKSAFTRHPIDERTFARFPAWNSNKMTYAGLLLPELLNTVDRVLYVGSDVLWLAPVEELFDMLEQDRGTLALVTRDSFKSTRDRENDWFKRKGLLVPGDSYFCAGMILFDLEGFRREHITERAFSFIQENPDIQFADQTVLNHLLYGRARIVPDKWQTLTVQITHDSLDGAIVLHYAGEAPWNRKGRWGMLSDTVMIWHRFNDFFVTNNIGASIRASYSVVERLRRRLLFLLLLRQWPRKLFYWLLVMTGRATAVPDIDRYLHPVRASQSRKLYATWMQLATRTEGRAPL